MSTSTAPTQDPFKLPNTKNDHSIESSAQDITIPYLPELFDPNFLEKILGSTTPSWVVDPSKITSSPFTTALKVTANRARTDNNAKAFASTESPTLDAFGTLDDNVSTSEVHQLLSQSWVEDPEATLRIIWNLRSIHDGKAAKKGFYRAFGWLYKSHPKTAIGNLSMLVDQVVERKLKPKKETEGVETKPGTEIEWTDVKKAELTPEEEVVPVGMSHGYFKDLLNILSLAAADTLSSIDSESDQFDPIAVPRIKSAKSTSKRRTKKTKRKARTEPKAPEVKSGSPAKIPEPTEAQKAAQADAKVARNMALMEKHATVVEMLSGAEHRPFKALYIAVARLFAKALAADVANLHQLISSTSDSEKAKLRWQFTMAGKWAPTLQGAHDCSTNISTGIALLMYSNGDFKGLSKQVRTDGPVSSSDAAVLRSFYRRWVVSPLRRYAQIPEVNMSAKEWNKINYSRVPSLCFDRNKKIFFKHDETRLVEYLRDVTSGKKTISGATLLPHELVRETLKLANASRSPIDQKINETTMDIVNAQWNALLEKLKLSGSLDNCMAVCDVSGSMGSLSSTIHEKKDARVSPILPSVALSLVLARIAKPPFENSFITFSATPSIVTLSDPTAKLIDHIHEIEHADAGLNTDFNAVFMKLLLPMAIEHKLKREDMIKRLFVFSDMQFDEASSPRQDYTYNYQTKTYDYHKHDGPSWETNHDQIVKAFQEAGYDMPEIVYWNLAGRVAAKPITRDTPGVSLLSGFSANMMKVFMDEEDPDNMEEDEWKEVREDGEEAEGAVSVKEKKSMTPGDVMKKALGKKSFEGLKVLD